MVCVDHISLLLVLDRSLHMKCVILVQKKKHVGTGKRKCSDCFSLRVLRLELWGNLGMIQQMCVTIWEELNEKKEDLL